MTNPYCSFLLRCWHLGGDAERIEIEHVHSGARTVVTSLAAALEWIGTHAAAPSPESGQPARQFNASAPQADVLAHRAVERNESHDSA